MEENIFLIKWYGPFVSREDERIWEKEQLFNCSLYLLHGKLKHAKSREYYYCGESTRNIYKRLSDKNHHIKEHEQRLNSIYVGCISNIKRPTRTQIMLAEKIIWPSPTDRRASQPAEGAFFMVRRSAECWGSFVIIRRFGASHS